MNISARKVGCYQILTTMFLIALTASAAIGQTKSFSWSNSFCDKTGTYNSKKYTETQLRNTLTLFGEGAVGLDFISPVWKFEEIGKIEIDALDREFQEKSERLRELDIVPGPFWEALRQETLKEVEQMYLISKTTAQAYTRPEVIRDYPKAPACKEKYADPLITGGDSLISAWRDVNLTSQKVNASPKTLQDRWDRENASPDRLKFALVETMAFGWWNCAVAVIERPAAAQDGRAEKEFRKLFTRVKEECDEP